MKTMGKWLLVALVGWALYAMTINVEPAHGMGAGKPADCAEDDPCFDCRTMGNMICGSDRWVRLTVNGRWRQVGPRWAANRFDFPHPGDEVCLISARGRGGRIRDIARCSYGHANLAGPTPGEVLGGLAGRFGAAIEAFGVVPVEGTDAYVCVVFPAERWCS